MLLSIFTPTFNRGYLLERVYKSLCSQKLYNFEWIVVDDGSEDNTEKVINSFIRENKIPIIYQKKENEGKHVAINKGVQMARGELFFIVDSDDYLTPDATLKIEENFPKFSSPDLAGISFLCGYSEDEGVGDSDFGEIVMNVFDFRYRMKIKGDMAEVFKTSVLKEFPFPEISGEKFCPEALIWNRIGKKYKMLWTSSIIYICEYLEGGLTNKIFEVRKNSPKSTLAFYSELEKSNIPFLQRIRANMNYWRFAPYDKTLTISEKFRKVNLFNSLIGMPGGFLYKRFKDS